MTDQKTVIKLTALILLITVLIGGVGFLYISRIESERSVDQMKAQTSIIGKSIEGAIRRANLHNRESAAYLVQFVREISLLPEVQNIGIYDSELNNVAHNKPEKVGSRLTLNRPMLLQSKDTGRLVRSMGGTSTVSVFPVFDGEVRVFDKPPMEDPGSPKPSVLGYVEMDFSTRPAPATRVQTAISQTVYASVQRVLTDGRDSQRSLQALAEDLALLEGADHLEVFSPDFRVILHSSPDMVGMDSSEDIPFVSEVFKTGQMVEKMEQEEGLYEQYIPIFGDAGPDERPIAVAEVGFSMEGTIAAHRQFQKSVLGVSAGLAVILVFSLGFIIRRVLSDKEKAEKQISYLVQHDSLTGLATRSLMVDLLDQSLIRSPWVNRSVAVISLNIIQFKRINESLGHQVGNLLLQAVGNRLLGMVRSGDTVARIGGDHFMVVLTDMGNVGDEGPVARTILEGLVRPYKFAGQELAINVSMGIAIFPRDGKNSEELLSNAETAMGRSQEMEDHPLEYYSPEMSRTVSKKLKMEADLKKGIQNGELHLNYQPIIEVKKGRIIGLEALMRWTHPTSGNIPPGEFIPVAEETGLIQEMGEWALRTACAQTRIWQENGNPDLSISINLSSRQFQRQDLLQVVRRVLNETGLDPNTLVLELTESILMKNPEKASQTLADLSKMGIDVSIDDFGTGYSSLSYVRMFPIRSLKIDRSFVNEITADPDDATIVKTIIALAHSLKLNVIAEGVETNEQLDFLRDLDCGKAQGFLFSRPLSTALTTELLGRTQKLII